MPKCHFLDSFSLGLLNIQKDWTSYGFRPCPRANHWNVPAKIPVRNKNGGSADLTENWLRQTATPLQKWCKQTVLTFREKHMGAVGNIVHDIADLANPRGS